MTYQQATFVKNLVESNFSLDEIAKKFYKHFGKTEYCEGPEGISFYKGKKNYNFSTLQGNDIKYAASVRLREKL